MTASAFLHWRRTGPLNQSERIALSMLIEALPRPVWGPRALSIKNALAADFALGSTDLRARGWIRVRGIAWELTARALCEVADVIALDAQADAAQVDAVQTAGAELVATEDRQRLSCGPLLMLLGWSGHHDKDRTGRASSLALFDRLMSAAAAVGADESDRAGLRAAVRRARKGPSDEARALAAAVADQIPLATFLEALGPAAWMVTRRAEITVH